MAESLYAEIAEALGSRSEAQWILERASDETEARSFCARRCSGEPLQYVLGTWTFRTLELEVTPEALIPRPETEQLVEVAIRRLATEGPLRCVDLGCGTGAIGLSLAKELGARGVRVNAIAPGYIDTPMTQALPEETRKLIVDATPLKSIGSTDDVANAVVFLASPRARFVTGVVLPVDGGLGI